MRKLVLLHAFALPGERWVSRSTMDVLDSLSPDELQAYVDANLLTYVDDEATEAPKFAPNVMLESASAEEPLPTDNLLPEELN